MAQMEQNRRLVGEVMESAVSGSMAKHGEKLEQERSRLARLDDAERKAREEFDQEQKALQEDARRLEEERKAMLQWEEFQEEKTEEAPQEVQVVELRADDGVAVLSD